MDNLNVSVRVEGNINGQDFEGASNMEIDLATGIIAGEVKVPRPPRGMATIASSGLSWWCNSNSGGGHNGNETEGKEPQ